MISGMPGSRLRLLMVFIVVMILSACSTSTDFVIINASDAEIEVKYQFKAGDPHYKAERYDILYPAVLTLQDFKARKKWQQLTEAGPQFDYDETAQTFIYRLGPGMVLRIDNVSNYFESESQFRVSRITINGPHGSIDLTGRQAQFAFKEVDNSDLGITYK
jgi:hypothetical protein